MNKQLRNLKKFLDLLNPLKEERKTLLKVALRLLRNLKGSPNLYNIDLSNEATEFFEAASAKLQERLDRAFELLKFNPRFHPNIKQSLVSIFVIGNLYLIFRVRVN
ncbi:hypothetical protein NUACC26_013390 [Scytonema sp. NUACC26]